MTRRLPSAPPLLPGLDYVRPLGSGGFADVFLYQQDMPRRQVAVKVLPSGERDPDLLRMFNAEADVLAHLSAHPAIVTVYQAGISADGRPYIVMEYCPGSLAQRYRIERMPVDEVMAIAVRLAGAMTGHLAEEVANGDRVDVDALDARGFVRLAAVLNGVPNPDEVARWALQVVELDPDDRRRTTTYSKGMKQRVKVAQALVNDPAVMVLDEPLTGLDPRQRNHLIDLFGRLGEEGRCVIVSSHVLDEVERFGSRVLVVAQGRLDATGDFHAIRELMDDRPHRIRVRTDKPRELATAVMSAVGALAVRLEPASAGRPGGFVVDTTDAPRFRRSIATVSQQVDAALLEVSPLDDDLDSVFRYLVQR